MDNKDAYIKQLEHTIVNLNETIQGLQQQIEHLTQIVSLLRKEKFGSSSEKTPKPTENVASLFNEVELEENASIKEPIQKENCHYKHRNPKTKREDLFKDLPVREVLCESSEEDMVCPRCQTGLKPIGKEVVREELEYLPAKLQIVRYIRMSYECPTCKHTEEPYIQKATTPTSLMNHSLASPSSVANVMYQKYVNSIPLYRQEKEWGNLGIALSRATMAHWVIRCTEDYLIPVVACMKQELLSRDILHCDETPIQVLKEEGKKPQTKSYMWLYRTGNDNKAPVIVYDYQPSRNGDHAVTFLKDFQGYLHSDGYAGYNKLTNIIRCGCWAHLRRKFVEAIPSKKEAKASLTSAEIGREYCNQLFQIEESLKDLSFEERKEKRLALERPVLEAFWYWLESLQVLKGSALGKAVTYAKNQKPYMEHYLLDERCAISNNAAENAIRPFTVGRKNWLFADTPKGATASAAIYSIVETAKANHLNVYNYLQYLLLHMPDTDWCNHPEKLEQLMPWSEVIQKECNN